jgi:hypothetical protein
MRYIQPKLLNTCEPARVIKTSSNKQPNSFDGVSMATASAYEADE